MSCAATANLLPLRGDLVAYHHCAGLRVCRVLGTMERVADNGTALVRLETVDAGAPVTSGAWWHPDTAINAVEVVETNWALRVLATIAAVGRTHLEWKRDQANREAFARARQWCREIELARDMRDATCSFDTSDVEAA